MTRHLTDNVLAQAGADAIGAAYKKYNRRFAEITAAAGSTETDQFK